MARRPAQRTPQASRCCRRSLMWLRRPPTRQQVRTAMTDSCEHLVNSCVDGCCQPERSQGLSLPALRRHRAPAGPWPMQELQQMSGNLIRHCLYSSSQ